MYNRVASARFFYGYSAYGEQTQVGANDGNSLQYTGRENDNTGLYFYRARYYDPGLKRFISQDPIGLLRIPTHAGTQFRSMPGCRSDACRAGIPARAGLRVCGG